jgi:hypothetical protein
VDRITRFNVKLLGFCVIFDLCMNLDLYQQKEDDVGALKTETQRLNKMRETIQRKLRSVEDQKADTEQQRETLRGQINALERGTFIVSYLGYVWQYWSYFLQNLGFFTSHHYVCYLSTPDVTFGKSIFNIVSLTIIPILQLANWQLPR